MMLSVMVEFLIGELFLTNRVYEVWHDSLIFSPLGQDTFVKSLKDLWSPPFKWLVERWLWVMVIEEINYGKLFCFDKYGS